jgi:hypothetical protein
LKAAAGELAMPDQKENTRVWIGVACVVPLDGCELLSARQGAYVNFLTLANSESEYRAKVNGALVYYRLEMQGVEDIRPFSESDGASEEIMSIAEELEANRDPNHVRFGTFHNFPRVM